MIYKIQEQAHSWLVIEREPDSGSNRGRVIAICGNQADADRVAQALAVIADGSNG